MLVCAAYTEAHPRRSHAFGSRTTLRDAALASRMNLRDAAHSTPIPTPIPTRLPHPSAPLPVTYSFRINTYKSVSKQRTLTPFRMNTYEKHSGVGVLLLTKHPMRMLILSERSEPKDLSSHPVRIAVLRSMFVSALSFPHQGRLTCHALPRLH